MTIRDNGFTWEKKSDSVLVEYIRGEVRVTGSLADLKDWFESGLQEVNDLIAELS